MHDRSVDSRNRSHHLEMDFQEALYDENIPSKKLCTMNEIRLALEDENKRIMKRRKKSRKSQRKAELRRTKTG